MDKTWIKHIESATACNGWTSDGALSRKSSPHDLHPRAPSASRWRCWVAQNKASIPRPSPNISASFSSSICCRKSTQSWAAASYLSPHAMAIWCCYCQLLIGFPRLLHFVSLRDPVWLHHVSSTNSYAHHMEAHGTSNGYHMETIKAFFPHTCHVQTALILVLHPKKMPYCSIYPIHHITS